MSDGHNPISERTDGRPKAGRHSLNEILSQPDCWDACFARLQQNRVLEKVRDRFAGDEEWLFIGCGSSYYVALCAAATMTVWGKMRARALPASEVLLYPELALSNSHNFVPVLISRSGQTSEVLQAAEFFRSRSVGTMAISCAEGQRLEKLASMTVTLPPADEKSTVMTRSFTSMLLALQNLALVVGKNAETDILRVSEDLRRVSSGITDKIQMFVNDHNFADYVCLGQGPFYGLACEYALKVTEMSVSYAQAFHTLEFRHGPKSIVAPETLVIFLLSEQGFGPECDVLEEIKSLGATTMVVTMRSNSRVAAAADLLIELPRRASEPARLAPTLFAGQLLGLYTGLKKGLDPDSPRNLSRAVILRDAASKNPEHAAF